MIDLTSIANAIITLIIAMVATVVVPYIRRKLTNAQYENLVMWVGFGVKAAEQLYKGSGRGEEKKKYVLDFLRKNGFTADLDALEAIIESAVNDLNIAQSGGTPNGI